MTMRRTNMVVMTVSLTWWVAASVTVSAHGGCLTTAAAAAALAFAAADRWTRRCCTVDAPSRVMCRDAHGRGTGGRLAPAVLPVCWWSAVTRWAGRRWRTSGHAERGQ